MLSRTRSGSGPHGLVTRLPDKGAQRSSRYWTTTMSGSQGASRALSGSSRRAPKSRSSVARPYPAKAASSWQEIREEQGGPRRSLPETTPMGISRTIASSQPPPSRFAAPTGKKQTGCQSN